MSIEQPVPVREKTEPFGLPIKLFRPDGSLAMERVLATQYHARMTQIDDLKGKAVLITGASSGIRAAALDILVNNAGGLRVRRLIRVNTVAPGAITTPFHARTAQARMDATRDMAHVNGGMYMP